MKNYQVQLKTDRGSSVYKTLYIKAYSVGQIVDQLGEDYYVTEVEKWKVDGSRTDRDVKEAVKDKPVDWVLEDVEDEHNYYFRFILKEDDNG